ncbi:MAG: DUF4062 domain-containing protein [Candidatus Binatia bacterium]
MRRLRIFISSTYEDLKVERQTLINELHRLGQDTVKMEFFEEKVSGPFLGPKRTEDG